MKRTLNLGEIKGIDKARKKRTIETLMNDTKLQEVLREYLKETIVQARAQAAKGQGGRIVGTVINRPEDIEIEIDGLGERIIKELLLKYKLYGTIYSEPENGTISNGPQSDFYGALDPFDGSVLFLHGFEQNWYTVLTFFDKERKPLCGGIGDILNEKVWMFDKEGVFVCNMKSGRKTPAIPSLRKSLQEPIVLASYVMSSQYSTKFFKVFGKLLSNMHPRALLYPNGGSCIYGYLADGKVDAYVMFDEPRSEIDPGFAIARAAGCEIGEVDEQGNWKDYEFIPGKQHDKVDLFIAASSRELRDELIHYYKEQKGI